MKKKYEISKIISYVGYMYSSCTYSSYQHYQYWVWWRWWDGTIMHWTCTMSRFLVRWKYLFYGEWRFNPNDWFFDNIPGKCRRTSPLYPWLCKYSFFNQYFNTGGEWSVFILCKRQIRSSPISRYDRCSPNRRVIRYCRDIYWPHQCGN